MFFEKVRIYYDNTDAQGIVYHSKYFDICERVRTDFLRKKNIIQSKLVEDGFLGFVVRRANIEYKKPAKFDDLVEITLEIKDFNNFIIKMEQNIYLLERKNEIINRDFLVKLNLDIVLLDIYGKLSKIPEKFKNILVS